MSRLLKSFLGLFFGLSVLAGCSAGAATIVEDKYEDDHSDEADYDDDHSDEADYDEDHADGDEDH